MKKKSGHSSTPTKVKVGGSGKAYTYPKVQK